MRLERPGWPRRLIRLILALSLFASVLLLLSSSEVSSASQQEGGWQLFVIDPAGQSLDAEQALAQWRAGAIEAVPGHGVGRLLQPGEFWLAFELRGGGEQTSQRFLTVQPPTLRQVDLYRVDKKGRPIKVDSAGLNLPVAGQSSAAGQNRFVLNPEPLWSPTILLRVLPGSLSTVSLELETLLERDQALRSEGQLVGALLTVATMMTVVALAQAVISREKEFLSWVLLAACGVFYMLSWNGVLMRWLPELGSNFHTALQLLGAMALIVSVMPFPTHFFQLQQLHPLLPRLLRAGAWSSLPVAVCGAFWGHDPGLTLALIMGAFAALYGVLIMLQLLRGQANADRYGLVGLALVAAAGYYFAGALGWLPFGNANRYVWQSMLVVTYLVLLGDLTWRAVQERRQGEAERDQLHQLLHLEAEQLEVRVEERTQALRTANAELLAAEANQRELLSLASHEFRNPATVIRSLVDGMRETMAEGLVDDVRQRLDNLHTAAGRLIFLANKLITHDRWRELSVRPQAKPLWVRAWVLDLMRDYEAGPPVGLSLPNADAQIQGDAVLLRIALQNLIDNAMAHGTKGSGSVHVDLTILPHTVEISVSDDGRGVPDEDKPKVFQRFVTGRIGGQGHGLGLAIVASVVRLHGGQVGVADAQPRGARFWMVLPRLRDTPQATA